MSISLATVFSCLARTAAVNAAITTRGMQQIGLAYILAPALREQADVPAPMPRAKSKAKARDITRHPAAATAAL